MLVIEEEMIPAEKQKLCEKLSSSLQLCDTNQDITTWLLETEQDRNKIRNDKQYFEYLKNEFETYRTILKLKLENPNADSWR